MGIWENMASDLAANPDTDLESIIITPKGGGASVIGANVNGPVSTWSDSENGTERRSEATVVASTAVIVAALGRDLRSEDLCTIRGSSYLVAEVLGRDKAFTRWRAVERRVTEHRGNSESRVR